MKIKSCEIKNFGKLSDKTITLDDKITVVRGKNESGKSTLSSFIKYVLYGYTGKGRDERSNEKLHYTPWSGSKSAGALVLETENGEIYRAERSADGRSGTAKIISSSGSECFDGYDAGEALYGIDASTFSKSAFVGQMDVEAGGMKDIGAGLERLVLNTDEDADFDKAQKELTSERNTLYNRMRSTGKIFELTAKLSELRTRKENETENHKTLIASRYSAEETEKIIKSNSMQLSGLYSEIENIDAYEAEEMLSKISESEDKCKQCEGALEKAKKNAERNGFLPDRKYLDELTKAFSEYLAASPDLINAKSELSECEGRYRLMLGKLHAGNEFGEIVEKEPRYIHETFALASTYYKKQKKFRNIAVVLCCFIVTLPIAVVMFILSSKQKKKLAVILGECGFNTFAEFEKFDSVYDELRTSLEEIREEISRKKKVLEEKKIECSVCEDLLREKLELIGYVNINNESGAYNAEIKDKLLPALRQEVFEIERALAEYSKEKNALDMLLSVSDVEKLRETVQKKQSEPPLRTREIVEREIKYLEGANALLSKKLSDLGTEIARLEAVAFDPAALEAEIFELEKQLSDAMLRRDAIELAIELIEKSRDDIRSNVLPKISDRATELFSRFTGGKYRKLFFDNDFEVSVLESNDTETRKIGYLSAGAIDAAYIALRIALAERLCREKPTFIFDDSFVKADTSRLENIINVLLTLSEEYQIIILTCHDREEKMLSGKCRLVVLDEI